MKRVIVAAGALLLGTSALAYAGTMDKPVDSSLDGKLAATSIDKSLASTDAMFTTSDKARMASWEKTLAPAKDDLAADSKFSFASLDKQLQPLAYDESGLKPTYASAETGWTDTVDKPLVTEAAFDKPFVADTNVGKTVSADSGKVQTDSPDAVAATKIASLDQTEYTGTGGPLEEVAPASGGVVQPSNANPELDQRGIPVISDVAYVPPGYNGTAGGAMGGPEEGANEAYPACTRERTDNCTQTYERGVHLASADTSGAVAANEGMGGPYEPVADDLAMNGDGTIDASKGETSDALVQTASADTGVVADHEYQGVGGPIEAQSGYPACSGSPNDDRCIQLYEPGVTGAGN